MPLGDWFTYGPYPFTDERGVFSICSGCQVSVRVVQQRGFKEGVERIKGDDGEIQGDVGNGDTDEKQHNGRKRSREAQSALKEIFDTL